ncbi:cysteine desulfurase family protein [Sphingorhabdus arenilitoris]|uniref:Cysteine desulfurase n=1 Tax=Sphingorhabdus arenilitoris TaxID=1490041 RepID=A0ABV8RH71_9SPHN
MIYLDYQSTTPIAPEAFAAMEPWLTTHFANPHSSHKAGRAAAAAVESARADIAALLPPGGKIIFTSGATEAINLAIKGYISAASRAPNSRPAIAYSAAEHAAIIDSAAAMAPSAEVAILGVKGDGHVSGLSQSADIGPGTLVCIMQVNNEIGTIQRLSGADGLIAQVHERGGHFLCDAVQSFGRMPVPAEADMIAISAHKIHGPKGIGALWLRDGIPLLPQQHGGGQEQGLRSGTLSPALCAGFGAAARLAAAQMAADSAHVAALWDRASRLLPGWTVNGDCDARYKGNLNIRKSGLYAARLISECRDILFSAGSACASGSGRPSHVLSAIGLTDAEAKSSIRLGFGRYTTMAEIEQAAMAINAAADAQLSS